LECKRHFRWEAVGAYVGEPIFLPMIGKKVKASPMTRKIMELAWGREEKTKVLLTLRGVRGGVSAENRA